MRSIYFLIFLAALGVSEAPAVTLGSFGCSVYSEGRGRDPRYGAKGSISSCGQCYAGATDQPLDPNTQKATTSVICGGNSQISTVELARTNCQNGCQTKCAEVCAKSNTVCPQVPMGLSGTDDRSLRNVVASEARKICAKSRITTPSGTQSCDLRPTPSGKGIVCVNVHGGYQCSGTFQCHADGETPAGGPSTASHAK